MYKTTAIQHYTEQYMYTATALYDNICSMYTGTANVYCIKHLFIHLLYTGDICSFVGIKNFFIE